MNKKKLRIDQTINLGSAEDKCDKTYKKEPLTIEESISRLETLFKSYQKDSEFNYQLTVSDSPFNQLKKLVSWQPIENYQKGKYDWVLVQFEEKDTKHRLIPRMAWFRQGKWTILSDDANEVKYLNECCRAIAFVDIQAQIIPIEEEKNDMTKVLTPLQAFEELFGGVKFSSKDIDYDTLYTIVETALKRLEETDNKPVCFVGRTRGQTNRIIEELSNHPEVKVTNLDDQNKAKALEIIKNKRVNVWYLLQSKDCAEYNFTVSVVKSKRKLTKKEYNFLKEILK